jgi:hypothetical protein
MVSCSKEEDEIVPVVTETKEDKGSTTEEIVTVAGETLYKGTFKAAGYATSGEVEVVKVNDVRKLVFKNFKTSAGPDLRIYAAKDIQAKVFTEITNSVKNGNYTIDIPDSVDPASDKHILIWCKKFSVLFGSAELVKQN